ncbi:MAG: hypothetical protein JETCAE01_17690 [Anaerolineaceae bacterium]|nr:MAG: hypothetical protein JETCAE01_17690 [Anaerolineaceae bacterium]
MTQTDGKLNVDDEFEEDEVNVGHVLKSHPEPRLERSEGASEGFLDGHEDPSPSPSMT